jgi:hypothetical protein
MIQMWTGLDAGVHTRLLGIVQRFAKVDYALSLLKAQSAMNKVRRAIVEQSVGCELAATLARSPRDNRSN